MAGGGGGAGAATGAGAGGGKGGSFDAQAANPMAARQATAKASERWFM